MCIKVLFIYPNTFGMNMLPPAIALFSAILKKEGHQVKVFDTTYYAVDHGIEPPEEREEKEKTRQGMIKASFKETGLDMFQFIIEDDGKGIDPKVIRTLVGQKNIVSKEIVKKLNDKEIIQFI